jgi:hypothetical protein
MNRYNVFICGLLFFIFFAACNDKQSETVVDAKPQKPESVVLPVSAAGCYRMIIARDTAFFEAQQDASQIKGKLIYNRFEKDANEGWFSGSLKDSVIDGWYRFQSEGMISVRQVLFKIRPDGNLSEGYGKMEMRADTAYFPFPHNLNFEDQHPYIKINCK